MMRSSPYCEKSWSTLNILIPVHQPLSGGNTQWQTQWPQPPTITILSGLVIPALFFCQTVYSTELRVYLV
jgi:hypothetical protein